MLLYRPVGLEELLLIYHGEMRAFPPRLPEQPIFYPVTNERYATQIARDWNTKSGSLGGFVTRFDVDDAYVSRFDRQIVGAREHEELWVPAEELVEFNASITAPIVVVSAFFGEGYRGHVPDAGRWAGKTAAEQFVELVGGIKTKGLSFGLDIARQHESIFLNYFFWEKFDFGEHGIDALQRDRVLGELKLQWDTSTRGVVPLGAGDRGDTAAMRSQPFRLVVRDVFRGGREGGTVVTGRVAGGRVRVGDEIEVVVNGSAARAKVYGLERYRQRVSKVSAGEEVGVGIRDVDEIAIGRGDELRSVAEKKS
jgi:hypothetical protein